MTHQHVWMTLEVAFYLLCAVGSAMFAMWIMACIIGGFVSAHHRRVRAQRKGHDHRVGGAISP
jgi:phosphatidylglycerophosphate synthase